MHTVPFLDLKDGYEELRSEIDAAVARVVQSGWYILGPEVDTFEEKYANYTRAKHCVTVGNGLDAIVLSSRYQWRGPLSFQFPDLS